LLVRAEYNHLYAEATHTEPLSSIQLTDSPTLSAVPKHAEHTTCVTSATNVQYDISVFAYILIKGKISLIGSNNRKDTGNVRTLCRL